MPDEARGCEVGGTLSALLLVLWCGCACPEGASLDCTFVPAELPGDELPGCASRRADGSLVLGSEVLSAIRARGPGPVATLVGGELYYLNAAGRSAPTLWFDNGPDYFTEGLARTTAGGKVGFVDRDLVVQIAPAWDFAFPFAGGVARVCQGCRPHADGEHIELRGGLWGYIDRTGREVVPVRYARDDLPPPEPAP